jgi:hypothetical protein
MDVTIQCVSIEGHRVDAQQMEETCAAATGAAIALNDAQDCVVEFVGTTVSKYSTVSHLMNLFLELGPWSEFDFRFFFSAATPFCLVLLVLVLTSCEAGFFLEAKEAL